ncbi:MAG: hypothetical protein AB2L24_03095 [Mangrovibacterium sp.]
MKISYLLLFLVCLSFPYSPVSGQIIISNREEEKVVTFGNKKLKMTLDYNFKCVVTDMEVNGESVISNGSGMYSAIRTPGATYTTCKLPASPIVKTGLNRITISNIGYGENNAPINETWKFSLSDTTIRFDIERTVSKPVAVEEVFFPCINFNSINTWEGAFLDFGGVAWFYLFNEKLCTYGVHSGTSVFWNSSTGNGMVISASSPGKQVVSKFTRSWADELVYAVSVSDHEMGYRYEPPSKRSRFIRGKTDVWDPFTLPAGKSVESVRFSWLDYRKEYDRGHLAGLNGDQVTKLLNTAARIGVIDAKHFGGNSWHTPYGPICLHEQYIAQLGIAINDKNYLEGYKQCLDYYRDQAIQPDGRVLARWAYLDIDAMPGKITPEGFYEAQWGYLLDSNPDFVTNVSELYHQNGDIDWVRSHKASCERALEYLLKRDSNGNHLVEMINSSRTEQKSSDWIDIVWASFENAFVNAKLYYALTLWSDIERQLGDTEKADEYSSFAYRLKASFNKSTDEGGFWDEKNKWYVHWLDQDRSVHGNNLVIPVNFMAVAYGICDDEERRKAILDRVEEQMQAEKLFFWPICLYSYEKDEAREDQFPFPTNDFLYENGDIFLSWGAVCVEAYASSDPELALRYIENLLARYEKDGLAFQRYGRLKQDGLGDDILSGNSLAIVGLYKSIYGINPMYNRLYLNPHLPEKLSGTRLNYDFRGDKLMIQLDKGRYSISNNRFKLTSASDFGFHSRRDALEYFNSNSDRYSLKAQLVKVGDLSIEIVKWDEEEYIWKQIPASGKGRITYSVNQLKADRQYNIVIDGTVMKTLKTDPKGRLEFDIHPKTGTSEIRIQLQ